MATELTHKELSLLVFALEGPPPAEAAAASCEEACPVASHFEELFPTGSVPPEKRLISHLNNHLREAFLECGMSELINAAGPDRSLSPEDQARLQQMNAELDRWSCKIEIGPDERRLSLEALSRLPRGAWFSMPRTMWRLRKKLKT